MTAQERLRAMVLGALLAAAFLMSGALVAAWARVWLSLLGWI